MVHALGIIIGCVAGLVWEKLATTPYNQLQTLFPSKFLRISETQVFHVHHWFFYALLLIITILWAFKTGRITHPAVLFATSFLIVALIYGFLNYPDWLKFIK